MVELSQLSFIAGEHDLEAWEQPFSVLLYLYLPSIFLKAPFCFFNDITLSSKLLQLSYTNI